jgi:6-phosphofructokinase 1
MFLTVCGKAARGQSRLTENLMSDNRIDFTISRLGECRIPSPMSGVRFTRDDERVLYHARLEDLKPWVNKRLDPPAMEAAGPREKLFFDPSKLACGIVTCGGLCPGLNDVIRSIVLSLHHHYGVNKVYGFRFGYEGLIPRYGHEPMELTPDRVNRINELGGTVLGSSRGPQDPAEMARTLAKLKVGILFAIGGDGTLSGAQKIAEEAARQGLTLSVIGIPKTIDNDVSYVQKTFGFETAVTEARRATYAANTEAEAARNGIGLVKLMGRDSGFIAAYSVLADSQVNFCLVPEVRFTLERFLAELKLRLKARGHAVVVVAEGAGQDLMAKTAERDASGNVKYGDIGIFLRDAIKDHFKHVGMEISLKYIDPSYTIRSVPANAHDSSFCLLMGQSAVHAGMSGRTNMVISFWNHQLTHVPISLAVSQRKKIDPEVVLWSSVLSSTGQPADMR